MSTRFVGLLRGVNVGGRNKLSMAAFAEAVRSLGYDDVSTYIQSGNVLFTASGKPRTVEEEITALIDAEFGLTVPVVAQSAAEMAAVVEKAPKLFASDDHRCDVIFLKHPLKAAAAMKEMPEPREDVDEFTAGPGVIYASRVTAQATKSRMSRITASAIYADVTIRNWNTTRKLHALLSQ